MAKTAPTAAVPTTIRQQIIECVEKFGTMRVAQIAEKINHPANNVSMLVTNLMKDGTFIGCKVTNPSNQTCWEVRIAAGAGMADTRPMWTPLRPSRPGAAPLTPIEPPPVPRRVMVHDLGPVAPSASAGQPAPAAPPAAPAAPVAPQTPRPPRPTPRREWVGNAPPPNQAPAFQFAAHEAERPGGQFRVGVFDDDALSLRNIGGDQIECTPEETRWIAHYLVRKGVITAEMLA